MNREESIRALLAITDCNEFSVEFYKYLCDRASLSTEFEKMAYLLMSMLLDIEMEGFADLFYQFYSLKDCDIVEQGLRQLGFNKLADLFNEAKLIYVRGKVDVTQAEYAELDPFTFDEMQGRRFDEIDDLFHAKDSELYLIHERLCQSIKKNPELLLSN